MVLNTKLMIVKYKAMQNKTNIGMYHLVQYLVLLQND